jgi:hypothetical protein
LPTEEAKMEEATQKIVNWYMIAHESSKEIDDFV